MTTWSKDATEFTVSVIKNTASRTNYSYIPKPILELFDNPKYLTFKIKDGQVVVSPGKK